MAEFDTACSDGNFVFQSQAATLIGLTVNAAASTTLLENTSGTILIGGAAATGTVSVGRSTGSQTLNIGGGVNTSGTTKAINIGTNGLSGSTTNINYGSTFGTTHTFLGGFGHSGGAFSVVTAGSNAAIGATTGGLFLSTAQTSGTITLGGTSGTGLITLGQSTATQTVGLATGATASGNTKTINIGTAGVSGSTTNINYGSAVAGATVAHTFNGTVAVNQVGVDANITLQVNGIVKATNFTTIQPIGAGTATFSIPQTGDNFQFGRTGPTFAPVFTWLDANRNFIYSNGQLRIGGAGTNAYVGIDGGSLTVNGGSGAVTFVSRSTGNPITNYNDASYLRWHNTFGDIMALGTDATFRVGQSLAPVVGEQFTFRNTGANNTMFIAHPATTAWPLGIFHAGASGASPVTGMGFLNSSGITVGTISMTSTAVAYNTTSDERLKENIADAETAGPVIDAIKARKFDWLVGGHQRYGFVAQELAEVFPEAVYVPEDPEAMMAVDYSKLVPLLLKEIQELRIRMSALEAS